VILVVRHINPPTRYIISQVSTDICIGMILLLSWAYPTSKLRSARVAGVFASAEYGMRALVVRGYAQPDEIQIVYAGPNSFDDSSPHVWYVIACVWGGERADGSGASINKFDHIAGITDEHSSIFAPGMLGSNKDYLFFVASGSDQNRSMGVLVLSGSSGPDGHGQWTFDYPKADGYGSYHGGFGQILLPPTQQGHCPILPGGNPDQQDQTFDLNYTAAGSLVVD
jgi:hypothetical protein